MIGSNEATRGSAFRATSAWLPLGLAAAAVGLLLAFLVTGPHAPTLISDHGEIRHDEGVAAHLWQLLMVLQAAAIVLFAVLWLPRDPKRAAVMLALQAAGFIAACAPLYLAEHGYFGAPAAEQVR